MLRLDYQISKENKPELHSAQTPYPRGRPRTTTYPSPYAPGWSLGVPGWRQPARLVSFPYSHFLSSILIAFSALYGSPCARTDTRPPAGLIAYWVAWVGWLLGLDGAAMFSTSPTVAAGFTAFMLSSLIYLVRPRTERCSPIFLSFSFSLPLSLPLCPALPPHTMGEKILSAPPDKAG